MPLAPLVWDLGNGRDPGGAGFKPQVAGAVDPDVGRRQSFGQSASYQVPLGGAHGHIVVVVAAAAALRTHLGRRPGAALDVDLQFAAALKTGCPHSVHAILLVGQGR